MILRHLRLRSFRAHATTSLEAAPKVNLLIGPNGAGKTNVLEAVHYLALSKSFIASQDAYVVRRGDAFFEVEGAFEGERRHHLTVRLAYVPGEGKRVFVNGAPLDRVAELVGMIPTVVLSPEDYALTAGGPDERRRFLDNILSQARPVYLDDLLKYRRALKQRNRLLQKAKAGPTPPGFEAALEPWTAEVVRLGSRLLRARGLFLQEFAAFMERAYRQLGEAAERPGITYSGLLGDLGDDRDGPASPDEDAIAAAYHHRLERTRRRERDWGRTTHGPHLDDLVFSIDDFEVRRYASQGQHRTFAMALKLAKYFYLADRSGEPPLFLLDDVFGNLDRARTESVLHLLASDAVGQSFITTAQREVLADVIDFEDPEHASFTVADGSVRPLPVTDL